MSYAADVDLTSVGGSEAEQRFGKLSPAGTHEAGHATEEELLLLMTHGILHLRGYDHAEADEEKEMFELQRQLLLTFLATRGRPSA